MKTNVISAFYLEYNKKLKHVFTLHFSFKNIFTFKYIFKKENICSSLSSYNNNNVIIIVINIIKNIEDKLRKC